MSRTLAASDATVWDTLQRLETAGWLKSDVERRNPMSPSRPARRLYRVTDAGLTKARTLLTELQVPGLIKAST